MSPTYLPLRMIILASLPCVGSAAYAEVSAVAAPTIKESDREAIDQTPTVSKSIDSTVIPSTTPSTNYKAQL